MMRLVLASLLALSLAACGSAASQQTDEPLRVYAVSTTQTPLPSATAEPGSVPQAQATPAAPEPTPTMGPVIFNLDFRSYRHDYVTMQIGEALQLNLMQGPTSDWLSGVDNATVLRPMAADGSGIYQAVAPGTALLTAHLLHGCANASPAVPCRNPEHGLWFQMRVYVLG
jgi:hypothetical protein